MHSSNSLPSPMAKRLQGKVAVITGGASGIGARTARLFVQHGAKVIVADVQDDLGVSLCREIGSDEAISYVHCDVTSESDVENAVNAAIAKHGKLDIMFSNAGIIGNTDPRILSTDQENLRRVFDVNVFGAFFCAKHAARVMIPAKKGSILFSSSVASVNFGDNSHAYSASKQVVVGLTKNLAVELGENGIRVNCISPYGMATPMLTDAMGISDKGKAEELFSYIGNLKGTKAEADDAAQAALYLVSDESKYVSGLNLVIDGGYSLTNAALRVGMKDLFS